MTNIDPKPSIRLTLGAVCLLVLLALARWLTGCTAQQGAAIAPVLATLGESACEALLPVADPQLGAVDVLACKGAEQAILAALRAAGVLTPPPASVSLGGGGAQPLPLVAHRPLRVAGQVVAIARLTPEQQMAVQAAMPAIVDAGADR
jgi:hypothetical protein